MLQRIGCLPASRCSNGREFSEARVIFGVVQIAQEIINDPQMHENGILILIDDPEIGATHTVSSPLQVVGVSKTKPSRAPRLGEHSTDILQELGFAAPEVASLLSAGAVSQSGPAGTGSYSFLARA